MGKPSHKRRKQRRAVTQLVRQYNRKIGIRQRRSGLVGAGVKKRKHHRNHSRRSHKFVNSRFKSIAQRQSDDLKINGGNIFDTLGVLLS